MHRRGLSLLHRRPGEYIEIVAEPTQAGAVYLFCLFLSHAYDNAIIPDTLAPRIDNATRDLFQGPALLSRPPVRFRASPCRLVGRGRREPPSWRL
jgi:hypothetical protein